METLLAALLLQILIAAAVFLTYKMTSNRIKDTNKRINGLQAELRLGFENMRSQIHHGDAALLADAKTKNDELAKQVKVLLKQSQPR